VTKAGVLRLTAIGLIACIAMGGVLAATGAADPVAQTAASVAKNVKKALRISKRADRKATSALKTARRAEKAAVVGSRGPTGPPGPQGERGSQGSAGTNGLTGATGATGPQGSVGLWEVFEATGTTASHVRGTASGQGRLGNGTFYVSFAPTDITGCAYLATVGSISDGTPPALYATVEKRTGFPTDLRLRAFDATGNLTDPASGNGFHVAVFCP
jgi:hypothetical protein